MFGDNETAIEELEAHRAIIRGKETPEKQNVLNLLGSVQDKNGDLYCITEFADGGPISNILEALKVNKKENFLPQSAQLLVQQYLSRGSVDGLLYMHNEQDSSHLDIKPDNIFYDKNTGKVKIADFGTSKSGELTGTIRGIGTPMFMSPESISSDDSLIKSANMPLKEVAKSSDVFSMGETLHQLVTGDLLLDAKGKSSWALGEERELHAKERGTASKVQVLKEGTQEAKDLITLQKQADTFMNEKLKTGMKKEDIQKLPEFTDLQKKIDAKKKEAYKEISQPTEFGRIINRTLAGRVEDRAKLTDIRQSPFFTENEDPEKDKIAQKMIGGLIELTGQQNKLDKFFISEAIKVMPEYKNATVKQVEEGVGLERLKQQLEKTEEGRKFLKDFPANKESIEINTKMKSIKSDLAQQGRSYVHKFG